MLYCRTFTEMAMDIAISRDLEKTVEFAIKRANSTHRTQVLSTEKKEFLEVNPNASFYETLCTAKEKILAAF